MPLKIVPLQTTGDGNCLLHALSRAMWGVEMFWELLRKSLHEELTTHLEWYKKIAAEKYEEKEFDQILHQASEKGQHLQFIHVFAMANVLKRPIIIYGSDEDIERYGMGEVIIVILLSTIKLFYDEIGNYLGRHEPRKICDRKILNNLRLLLLSSILPYYSYDQIALFRIILRSWLIQIKNNINLFFSLALLPHSCLLASEHRYETVNY
jgi:hypothetical protein